MIKIKNQQAHDNHKRSDFLRACFVSMQGVEGILKAPEKHKNVGK